MPRVLAPLRRQLDLMPSPLPERPGLLVRDPFRYAAGIMILPPPLVASLLLFDGRHSDADLASLLAEVTGEPDGTPLAEHLERTLSEGGFLHDEAYDARRDERHREFAAAAERPPMHAGGGYPEDPVALRETLDRYFAESGGESADLAGEGLMAVAAPHASPDAAWRSYTAAYASLGDELADHTFVVLGTSHYGAPGRFGLTRKPYLTPLGATSVDTEMVAALEGGGPAARLEDYCHAVEHSIEFQAVFLQHRFGAGVRMVPVLCGPLGRAAGVDPGADPGVQRFLDALRGAVSRSERPVFWILGVDMAHVGRRYGDTFDARANEGGMGDVAREDAARIERVLFGDAVGFWSLIEDDSDPLKWCGASPIYTFLSAAAPARGRMLRYEQWNIDEKSVVSYAALAFHRQAR